MPDPSHSSGDAIHHDAVTATGQDLAPKNQKVTQSNMENHVLTEFRIVMDEIHTIGQQEGGAVWEQILLLAPCPVM